MADGTQVVQDAYGAFARGDIPAVLETLAEDVDWNVPEAVPHGGHFHGSEAVGGFFQGIGQRWEDFSVDIEDLIEGGDEVVGIGRARGDLRGTGEAAYGFTHVFTVRDGRIVRFREYVDPDATLRSA